jgi:Phage integrase family
MSVSWTLLGLLQRQVTDLVCNFFAFECGVRNLAPDSIKGVYLPGIVNLLTLNRLPSAELLHTASSDSLVKMTHRGFQRLYRLVHPLAASIKLAFTAASAMRAHALLLSGAISLGGSATLSSSLRELAVFRIFAALLFGIMFLLRKSEFLFKAGKPFPPTRASLSFFDAGHILIPDNLVGVTPATWLVFGVAQSKADQDGNGRVSTHRRQPGGSCIVAVMEQFFRRGHLLGARPSDSLFAVPGLPTLSSHVLSRVMKATVTAMGLPADRVSTHSLRYGGATMLAAGGYPEYIIAMYGGWAEGSTSLRRYTRPSVGVVCEISRHMQSMQLCNMEDDLLAITVAKAARACASRSAVGRV